MECHSEASFDSHWQELHQPTEGDLVIENYGCPRCGERRMDWLLWLPPHNEHVECQSCCYLYEP